MISVSLARRAEVEKNKLNKEVFCAQSFAISVAMIGSKGVGLLEYSFQPDTFEDHRLAAPRAVRQFGFVAWQPLQSLPRDTQTLRRSSPLIAPVTLTTFPAGQDALCTNVTSYGARIRGSDFSTVWAKHGIAVAEKIIPDAKARMFA
jgi:hypothetical protein